MLVLFGDQWTPAAPILSVLAIAGTLFPIHVINLQVVLAQGRSQTFFRVEIWKKLVGIACVIVGSFFGIMGMAYSQIVVSLVALMLNTAPVSRSIGYGLFEQLRDLWDIPLCAAAMAAGVLLLRGYLSLSPLAELLVLSGAGALIYSTVGLIFRLPNFRSGLALLPLLLRRSSATDPTPA
jgi:O-antigen/teichoic acid export membrane protein